MCQGLMDVVTELEGPSLATCIWSLARMGRPQPAGIVDVLLEELIGSSGTQSGTPIVKMAQCTFSQLADIAWSLAKLQVGG